MLLDTLLQSKPGFGQQEGAVLAGLFPSGRAVDEDDEHRPPLFLQPASPMPLVKSSSAPAACFADRVARGEFGANASQLEHAPSVMVIDEFGGQPAPWQCRGCENTDRSLLSVGSDSSLACELCGTVDADVSLISMCRQKNCAEVDDKTVVADAPKHATAQDLSAQALANGPETPYERRKRLLQSSDASTPARSVCRKYDLSKAQNKINADIVRDARLKIEGDSKTIKKRDAVLRFVHAVHQFLGSGLDERIKRHIRMEAVRVIYSGYEHAQHCSGCNCQVLIPTRANAVLALCIVQKCLENLVCVDVVPGQQQLQQLQQRPKRQHLTISALAPEVSRHEIYKSLNAAKVMQNTGSGASQRAQVLAVVGMVLDWMPEHAGLKCGTASSAASPLLHPQPPLAAAAEKTEGEEAVGMVPPPLALPPPLHAQAIPPPAPAPPPPGTATASASYKIYTLRNLVHAAARVANVPADVRQAATAALQEPALGSWLRGSNTLPLSVLGVVIIKASAIKLKYCAEDNCQIDNLLRQYCRRNDLSVTTAEEVVSHIVEIIRVHPAAVLGLFGDGIF
jgi:hypothetical protein